MDSRDRKRCVPHHAPILATATIDHGNKKDVSRGGNPGTHKTPASTLPHGHSKSQHTVAGLPSRSSPCTTRQRRSARSVRASRMSAARRAASSTASRSSAVAAAGAAAARRHPPPSGAPAPAPTRAAARAAVAAVAGAATQAVRGSPPSLPRGAGGGVAMVDCRRGGNGGRQWRVTAAGATTNAMAVGRGGRRGANGKGARREGAGAGRESARKRQSYQKGGSGTGNSRARVRVVRAAERTRWR